MNILICSVGKHANLVKEAKMYVGSKGKIIVTSNREQLSAFYFADEYYITSDVQSSNYVSEILNICQTEKIDVLLTMLDLETTFLSKYENEFLEIGTKLLLPSKKTADLCYDKFQMYKYLKENKISTIETYGNLDSFLELYNTEKIDFPVFVKPRTGRGSVGAKKISNLIDLQNIMNRENGLIIQEYIDGVEFDVDVYTDMYTGKPLSIFAKKKIYSSIGGTVIAESYINRNLNIFVEELVSKFKFSGPINIELFYHDNKFILSEINPRFSAAYLHALYSGVNFFSMIESNFKKENLKMKIVDYQSNIKVIKYEKYEIINNGGNND